MPRHTAALPAPFPAQGTAQPHPGWARTTLRPDPSSPQAPGCVTGMPPETPTPRRMWWLVPLRGRSGPCHPQGQAQDLLQDAEMLQQSPWQLQYTARVNKTGGRGERKKEEKAKKKKKKEGDEPTTLGRMLGQEGAMGWESTGAVERRRRRRAVFWLLTLG